MPRLRRLLTRRAGPLGAALTAWDLWRRIPKQHRREIVRQARKHGPRAIRAVRRHGPLLAAEVKKRRTARKKKR